MESIDRSPGRHAAFGQLSLEGEELGSNVLRFEAPLRPDTKSPLPDHSGVHRLLTDAREAADGMQTLRRAPFPQGIVLNWQGTGSAPLWEMFGNPIRPFRPRLPGADEVHRGYLSAGSSFPEFVF